MIRLNPHDYATACYVLVWIALFYAYSAVLSAIDSVRRFRRDKNRSRLK